LQCQFGPASRTMAHAMYATAHRNKREVLAVLRVLAQHTTASIIAHTPCNDGMFPVTCTTNHRYHCHSHSNSYSTIMTTTGLSHAHMAQLWDRGVHKGLQQDLVCKHAMHFVLCALSTSHRGTLTNTSYHTRRSGPTKIHRQ